MVDENQGSERSRCCPSNQTGERGETRDYLHQRGPWGALELRALQEQLKTASAAAQRLAEREMKVGLTVAIRARPDERRWTEEQAG